MDSILSRRLAAISPAMALFFGCQNQELDIVSDRDGAVQGREMIITADLVDGTADTRTSSELVEGGKTRVYWSPGDQIKVFSAGESSIFESQNTVPSRTAKFKGTVSMIFGDDGEGEVDYIWGLYPSREDATYSEPDGTSATALITTTLPSVQQGKEDSFADGTFVTIGRSAESLRIPFKGVCTGVYITFENDTDIYKVTLSGLDNEVLAGRFTAGLDEGADGSLTPYIESVSEPEYAVTVVAPEGGTFKKGKMYYIITLPVKFTRGFSLTAHKTTGEVGTCSITPASAPEFKVNAIGSVKKVDNRITTWVQTGPAPDEIWYTTTDGSVAEYYLKYDGETGNEVVSNTYPNSKGESKGVIKFAAPITEIDAGAFLDNRKLLSVTLPDCVETIKQAAFGGCSSLSEITMIGVKQICLQAFGGCAFEELILPEGLEILGEQAFMDNPDLQQVVLPQSLTTIDGSNPFMYCGKLSKFEGKFASEDGRYLSLAIGEDVDLISFADYGLTSYTVPGNITVIDEGAFSGCNSLERVILSEGLVGIGSDAFCCENLIYVSVPASVSWMGMRVFNGSLNLKVVRMNPQIPPTIQIPIYEYGHPSCAIFPEQLQNSDDFVVYVPYYSADRYRTFDYWKDYWCYMYAPESDEIWYKTTDWETLSFTPAQEEQFGIASYPDYGSYSAIKFKNDITEIPESFLAGRTTLKNVFLPDGVEKIDGRAFDGCTSLEKVEMGYSLQTIQTWAFRDCALTSVSLPGRLSALLSGAFMNNPLTTVSIPSGIEELAGNPFEGCDQLTSFTGGGQNVIVSDDGKFLKDADGRMLSFACGITGEYTVPDGVTSIEAAAFKKSKLSRLVLPSTVTAIKGWNFLYCPDLTEVVINSTALTEIGDWNFYDCPDLLNIWIMSATPPALGGGDGNSCFTNMTSSWWNIWVPAQSYDAYRAADGWKEYRIKSHIIKYRSSLADQADNEIWYTNNSETTTNVVWNGGIEYLCFYDYDVGYWVQPFNLAVTEIPDDILTAGKTDLRTVVLPKTIEVIGDGAFENCSNLESVIFADNSQLESINQRAFAGCRLSSIDIPESVTYIEADAFKDNTTLTTARIPADCEIVDGNPFRGCSSLASFTGNNTGIVESGKVLINAGYVVSFAPASGLSSYSIASTVAGIAAKAFYGCTGLNDVHIPASVTYVGADAFSGCTGMTDIYLLDHTELPVTGSSTIFSGIPSGCKIHITASAYQDLSATTLNKAGWTELESHFVIHQ